MESLEDRINKFLSVSSSSGFGSGDSSGFSRISGSGEGAGFSTGCGRVRCNGFGDACESYYSKGPDFINGVGCGYGFGFGEEDNSGYGYGFDSKLKSYNRQKVYQIDSVPTLIYNVRGQYATGYIIRKNKTLLSCYIARCGDYFAHGETLHKAQSDALVKFHQNMSEEERIAAFISEHPSLSGVHPCEDLFRWHNILTGSCEMGRKQFCLDNDIDLKADYTVKYFLEITKESYGGSIIKAVAERYKENEERE